MTTLADGSLAMLVADLASGRVQVVDLTHTLSPDFPQIVLPPEFGQCAPFRMEEISRYDERGASWYWNNFSCGEHTGTDWSKRTDPAAFQNYDAVGQHSPGPDPDCVRFLVDERDIVGFGTETIGTDAGQAAHLKPPYPAHFYLHGANRYGLQCLRNLDQLPPQGAVLICPPLKIRKGSGSPLRVLALVPAGG